MASVIRDCYSVLEQPRAYINMLSSAMNKVMIMYLPYISITYTAYVITTIERRVAQEGMGVEGERSGQKAGGSAGCLSTLWRMSF